MQISLNGRLPLSSSHTHILLQQGQKSSWFHIRKLDFRWGRRHPTVEHGIKHCAPNRQNKPVNG